MTIKISDGPTLRSIWEAQIKLTQWVMRKRKNKIKEDMKLEGREVGASGKCYREKWR